MRETNYLLKKKGTSELYTGMNGKTVQFDTRKDAEFYENEAWSRTRIEWEVLMVSEYYAKYHPKVESTEAT